MSDRPETPNKSQENYDELQQEKEKWLIYVLCVVTIIGLFFISVWIDDSHQAKTVFLDYLHRIIPSVVLAIVSYLVIEFLFTRKGISSKLNFSRQLFDIKQQLQTTNRISSVRFSPIINTLIDQIKQKKHDDLKLYTFYGLDKDISDKQVLQDFSMETQKHQSSIQFLWVAPDNKLCPSINQQENSLRISFQNQCEEGSNIAIRLIDNKPHCKAEEHNFLTFEARLTEDSNENVLLAFRVVNGWLQHWHYAKQSDTYTTYLLKKTDNWQFIALDLNNSNNWRLFEGDGNYIYGDEQVDFSIISSIIFEFGSLEKLESDRYPKSTFLERTRPGKGQGVIEIKNIKLSRSEKQDEMIIPTN